MTGSKHEYSLALLTIPETPLSLDENDSGTVGFDAGRAPHVVAGLRLSEASAAVLAGLDPRQTPRVRLDVSATFPTTTQGRSFNLGVRNVTRDQADGVPVLSAASDEALLSDYRTMSDDGTPFKLAASLRAVINYVLGVVSPGAALEASPAHDANMTPVFAVTNLMPNPTVRLAQGNWLAGGTNGTLTRGAAISGTPESRAPSGTITAWTGNSGLGTGGAFAQTATAVPYAACRGSREYTVSTYVHANIAKTVRLSMQMFGDDGALLSGGTDVTFDVYSAAGALLASGVTSYALTANTFYRFVGRFKTLPNAARLGPFIYPTSAVQWANGNSLVTLGWMLHDGWYPVPVRYFDASTAADATYAYAATGTAHQSAATRTPLVDGPDPDALIWRSGRTALEFLQPLVQSAGYRLVCDEQRRWTLRDESYEAAGTLAIRYGVNMIAGGERISRDSDLWFDARVTRYRWKDRDGVQQERSDAFALPGYTKATELVVEAPYPGTGRSEYAVRRAQGRGREVTATKVADWTANAEQVVTVVLDGAPTQVGSTQTVSYDLAMDRMTINTRTTDTPESAWVLIPEGDSWLVSPVGESWTEEVI